MSIISIRNQPSEIFAERSMKADEWQSMSVNEKQTLNSLKFGRSEIQISRMSLDFKFWGVLRFHVWQELAFDKCRQPSRDVGNLFSHSTNSAKEMHVQAPDLRTHKTPKLGDALASPNIDKCGWLIGISGRESLLKILLCWRPLSGSLEPLTEIQSLNTKLDTWICRQIPIQDSGLGNFSCWAKVGSGNFFVALLANRTLWTSESEVSNTSNGFWSQWRVASLDFLSNSSFDLKSDSVSGVLSSLDHFWITIFMFFRFLSSWFNRVSSWESTRRINNFAYSFTESHFQGSQSNFVTSDFVWSNYKI